VEELDVQPQYDLEPGLKNMEMGIAPAAHEIANHIVQRTTMFPSDGRQESVYN
jgi:hypothetical protein